MPCSADDGDHAAADADVTLVLLGTSLAPGYLASPIFFAVLLVFVLDPPVLVFARFESTAVWLIVSGFVIGAATAVLEGVFL
ncbi:hypothetical protein IT41_07360 [Paracoccus halophilus]|uniref:Uncharacterized protein n=1 Tax=Paracoccus halophilus TaxID=376733 RepID=A0A099F4W9_9RHOB|nr:hypothetical protein [Paracoccus halophilus]KGJ05192.1 hypothetical protein IT41_07360 [Paracoccus halophilus]